MTQRSFLKGLTAAVTLLAVSAIANADVVVGQPTGLVLEPAKIELNGKRSRQQLIVTGQYGSANPRDLSGVVQFTSTNEKVVKVTNGIARPVADGTANIVAKAGGKEVSVPVTVKNFAAAAPHSFKIETLAALSKAGCNMGACHGSPSGKGGFRLSLRAYDPPLDIMTLRTEFFGRRTNVLKPED
ncbi:MAG: hypothetical protein CMJ78_05650, partial [Planctomycetaceae bacterium]|nr:hypothetical protein [Planctomycetaceae bacterium]